jgi:cell wall-active antibiotic response 4TMS protein YvqF
METVTRDRPANHGRIMFGVLVIAAGLLLLIDRLELMSIHLTSHLWPLFPLGLGLLRAIDPAAGRDGRHARRSGVWLMFIGCWGLMNEFHVLGFYYDNSWPLVIIFAGITIVWRSIDAPAPPVPERRDP